MLIDGFWTFQKKKMLEIINEKNVFIFLIKPWSEKIFLYMLEKRKRKANNF